MLKGRALTGKEILRELYLYFRKYRGSIILGCLLVAVGLVLSLAVPLLSQRIIDDGLLRRDIHKINQLGLVFLVVAVASYVVGTWRQYVFVVVQQRVMVDLRTELTRHVFRLPMQYLNREAPGYLMSRVDGDVGSLAGLMTDKFVQAAFDLLTLLCTAAILIYLNWKLAVLISVLIPLYLVSLRYFSAKTYSINHELREIYAQLSSKLQEMLASIYAIKIFNREDSEAAAYVKLQKRAVSVNLRMVRINLLSSLIVGCILTMSPLVVIWYGGLQVARARMTIGSLFAFNMYLAYLFGPLRSLYDSVLSFQSSLASLERVHEIRSVAEQEAYEAKGYKDDSLAPGKVEFRGVSFSYDRGHEAVLQGLNFRADGGRTTAIVGRSGEGKTTIFNLLLKIYEEYEGTILVDGKDLKMIELESLRQAIKLVPQDPLLLNRTALENITYGRAGASEAEARTAATIARADEFIMKLPNGYQTVIGDRGITLSGGEKQRIALARALMGDPKVLLLDEATSFLDSDTESEVQEAMESAFRGRTCIVVAHRLNTVLKSDKICMLAEGRVLASGTHGELYSRCAPYASLVDKQFQVREDISSGTVEIGP